MPPLQWAPDPNSQHEAAQTGLAPYASSPWLTRGRAIVEAPSGGRTPFERDRDRVLHAAAFRRLALKTQVILPAFGESHRTRLTHTLEVAQIARSMARALRLDEDLTEALALAHDLGHTPFGHTGEEALGACMADHGGFDHNAQSLRIVVELERRYLDFDGLNLTWETLEGLAKRGGPCELGSPMLEAYDRRFGFRLQSFPSAEAQVAALADDIAYNAHDLEDGLRAGLVRMDDAANVPIVGERLARLTEGRERLDVSRLPFALSRALIDCFVKDGLQESQARFDTLAATSPDQIRDCGQPVAALSDRYVEAGRQLKRFLFDRLYRHPDLVVVRQRAASVITDLGRHLLADPDLVPIDCRSGAEPARMVCDYIAGMTDHEAIRAHRRFFDATPDFG